MTVTAPAAGGLVTSYTLTASPGGTRTLTAPGTVTIAVAGCATATATATATGPGGTSASSATATARGCVPPGPVRNIASAAVQPPTNSPGDILVTWDPPADTGGGALDYVVTIHYNAWAGVMSEHDETAVVSGTSYERAAPAGRDPYARISVAARNAAGTGPALVGYTTGGG